jgi:microcystin-dependent protein
MTLESFQVKKGIESTDSSGQVTLSLVPVGVIALWPLSGTVPSGWLECVGGTFSSNDYPELATIVGNSFGTSVGDLYYLPDFRGRVAMSSNTVGAWGGSETVTATNALTSHQHSSPHTHTMNSHSHSHTGHSYDAHGVSHGHSVNPHTHPLGPGGGSHIHPILNRSSAGFGPGTQLRASSATNQITNLNTHNHTSGPTPVPIATATETSGEASSTATGDSSPSSTGQSATTTTLEVGSTSVIPVVQKSYSLRYIIRGF